MSFVNMHRYQNIEKYMYNHVIKTQPKKIVELGHGSSAVTVAMAKALSELNNSGRIYSYDIIDSKTKYSCMGVSDNSKESAYDRIYNRGLTEYVEFIQGDVFKTFVSDPFDFDLILIDIDNTWDNLYSILISNKVINDLCKSAQIIIEGGDNSHPRINKTTLKQFNTYIGRQVFSFNYLTGSGRTSISKLII